MNEKTNYGVSDNKKIKIFLGVFFFIYLLVLGWFLFVSIGLTNRNTYFKNREVHLIPFKSTYTSFRSLDDIASIVPADQFSYYQYLFLRNIIGNIFLLIPFGFILPVLFQRLKNFKSLVIVAVLFSVFIESIQYIFNLGVFDIDDMIYNVIGTTTGFYMLRVIKSSFLFKKLLLKYTRN